MSRVTRGQKSEKDQTTCITSVLPVLLIGHTVKDNVTLSRMSFGLTVRDAPGQAETWSCSHECVSHASYPSHLSLQKPKHSRTCKWAQCTPEDGQTPRQTVNFTRNKFEANSYHSERGGMPVHRGPDWSPAGFMPTHWMLDFKETHCGGIRKGTSTVMFVNRRVL